jgi:hypothetical protein
VDKVYTNPSIKLYIPINDSYYFVSTSRTGYLHGWAISSDVVEVKGCVYDISLVGGVYYSNDDKEENNIPTERTFDITLANGTSEDATIDLVVDRSSNYSYVPTVVESTGLSRPNKNKANQAIIDNKNIIKITLNPDAANGITQKIVYVEPMGGLNDNGLVRHIFNFSIAQGNPDDEITPEQVVSIDIEGDPRTTYVEGQKFSLSGFKVIAELQEGGTATIPGASYTVTPRHVLDEYNDSLREEFAKGFFEKYELSGYDDDDFYLYTAEFDEYMGGFEESSFEEYRLDGHDNEDEKDYRLLPSDTYVIISFGVHAKKIEITVSPSADIADVKISNGQLFDKWVTKGVGLGKTVIEKTGSFDAVVWYGETHGRFSFEASGGAKVYVEGVDEPLTPKDGLYHLDIDLGTSGADAVVDGVSKTVTVTTEPEGEDPTENTYTFTCYLQKYGDMPAWVYEYLSIASQYTNGTFISGEHGMNPVRTLRGDDLKSITADINSGCVSIGNFGGYITYRYPDDKPITDDPRNPYGVDFIVYGNTSSPNSGFSEPGNVLVSSDGVNWYTLAGSAHYEDYAKWNHRITYTRSGGGAKWEDESGNSGASYSYPMQDRYPHFSWEGKEDGMTLEGVFLQRSSGNDIGGSVAADFPDFGYADTGLRADSNAAGNPYGGNNGRRDTTDGFDLKWAVDKNGKPVDLSKEKIYYVKIQTASFILNSSTGEKSTEVNGVRKADPSNEDVGVTDPPEITVDGRLVNLSNAVIGDVPVWGVFTVSVGAPVGANVYINGVRGASRTFNDGIPDHGMLRVIVQEGVKAPVIYYMNLVAGAEGQEDKYTLVTFDADGGTVSYGGETAGILKVAYTPDLPDGARDFPTPKKPDSKFDGWFDNDGKQYAAYSNDMGEALTLTAKWEAAGGSGISEPVINSTVESTLENGKPRALDPDEYKVLDDLDLAEKPDTVLTLPTIIDKSKFEEENYLSEAVKEKLENIINFDEDGAPFINKDMILEGLEKAAEKTEFSVPAVDKSSLGEENKVIFFVADIKDAYDGEEDENGAKKLAIQTFAVDLSSCAGSRIDDVIMLKIMADEEGGVITVPLVRATAAYDMQDGEFIFTDDNSDVIHPEHKVKPGFVYYVTLAIRDDGPYDTDPAKGTVVDPSFPAPAVNAAKDPASAPGSGEFSGGCDAGLGIAPFAVLAIGLALYRRKRNLP